MESPIFILGSHKSGTSLLRSLLDGHPDLFAVPVEAHFFQLMAYWVTYAFSKQVLPKPLSTEEFIQHTIGAVTYFNQEDNPQGDGISKGRFDLKAFEQSIRQALTGVVSPRQTESRCFEAYMAGLYQALYQAEINPQKRVVEKSVENVEFALDLYRIFPQAKFLHIIRNPYANLESMRKFRMHNKKTRSYPWLGRDFRSLCQTFYCLDRNPRFIPNYKVIRYEDLVTQPKEMLGEICDHLGIAFEDSILTPTYMGDLWGGNSTTSESFKGISAKNIDRYKKTIEPVAIQLVNKYLPHILADFGYETLSIPKSPIWPASREGIKEYIANRFLLEVG